MLISMNWIREFVNLDSIDLDDLIHRFTLTTAEVEDVFHYGNDTTNVVIAQILSIENHPDSRKLHLLKVDAGDKIYDCVCGAPNVREGMKVAFAKAGGSVCGNAINEAKVAGYVSYGMCCSEAELGISADTSGLMEITDDYPLGTDIKSVYAIEDTVFEVDNKSLTNRPDLWGHYGIAREFAAIAGRELLPLATRDLSCFASLPEVPIEIVDTQHAYRYSSITAENITVKKSPVNMRIRLYYCGTRALNLLADLTNYIMLEMGQPMHAFDNKKVDKIEVKRFDSDFEFETLDSVKRKIDTDMLMICSGGESVAIAGVMGGLASEITDETDSLLLESANFDCVSVRKTSSRLGLRTDASARYEKSLDPEMTIPAVGRFMQKLFEIDPGVKVTSSLTDCYVRHFDKITIELSKADVDRYAGIDIPMDRIVNPLSALGFEITVDGDKFTVGVPSWRATKDVSIKADIIEEITRIYGYDNFVIKTTVSALRTVRASVAKSDESAAKDLLVRGFKLHEVHTYIWSDAKKFKEIGLPVEDNVKILNAMTVDHDTLRRSITPSLIAVVADNKAYATDFGVFEVGRVAEGTLENGYCNERKKLGIVLFSKTADEKTLYLRLRDTLASIGHFVKHEEFTFANCEAQKEWQHPVNTAEISLCGKSLGFMTVVHPNVKNKIDKKSVIVCAELDMGDFSATEAAKVSFNEPSKYPGIDYDLSLVMNKGVSYSDIEKTVMEAPGENFTGMTLTDVYDDGKQKSITVNLAYASNEKTLTREEVQAQVDAIVARLAAKDIPLKAL